MNKILLETGGAVLSETGGFVLKEFFNGTMQCPRFAIKNFSPRTIVEKHFPLRFIYRNDNRVVIWRIKV